MSPVPGKGSFPEPAAGKGGFPENGGGLSASQTSLNSSVEVTEVQEELVAINLR